MKKMIIIGFGDRGQIYASYALKHPDKMKVVGVVDSDIEKLKLAQKKYDIEDKYLFDDYNNFIKQGKIADAVINATMDLLHYETAMPLFKLGYDVLLEKPVSSSKQELFNLLNESKKYGKTLMICHVLRYAPFYRKIKEILLKKEIGEVVNLQLTEHVGLPHMISSYVRGKWSDEKECGSTMLMAKCCHDTDLLVWLNNLTHPTSVTSFGSRQIFVKDKAPKDCGEKCLVDCKYVETCPYSTKKLYLDNDSFPFLVWQNATKKTFDKVTLKEKIEFLKSDHKYARCVYKIENDLVDHQSVLVEYDNGSTATLNMIGGTSKAGRKIHIIGTNGEIEGFFEDNKFVVRFYNKDTTKYDEKLIKIDEDVSGAHGGGDLKLVEDFINKISGNSSSISSTVIDDSICGHLLAINADISKKEKKLIKMEEI